MNDIRDAERGSKVNTFLQSEEWREAWDVYDALLLAAIVDPKWGPADVEHQRKLLWAAKAARQHLERLVNHGKVAAATLNIEDEQRSPLRRAAARWGNA